ncbi:MAG: hypothetical protein LBR51_03405 [Bacteroidales bacterium]|jgi:lipopolysaccharide export system protein LptA|nr:hypothetical protein [Bacteroidales bacterium]
MINKKIAVSVKKYSKKIFYFVFLFLVATCPLFAQEGSEKGKWIYEAEEATKDDDIMPGTVIARGHVFFYNKGDVKGYCDSAYLYDEGKGDIEAFGKPVKVHINDTVTLYGLYFYYNITTKIASISREVKLEDNTSTLYTDSLIYDRNTGIAYYVTGGKIINKDNTLTSIKGKYYTRNNDVKLQDNVLLVNEKYAMDCDSLGFNTRTEVVRFLSRTHLVSEENIINTTSGWYDTKQDIALLIEQVEVYNESQQLFGDSIYYEKMQHFGRGWKNTVLRDTVKNYVLKGNYAEYYEDGGLSTVTDSALLILVDNEDSLFMHADTIKILIDSLQEPQALYGYFHAKFYRADIQGVCDSMVYIVSDSTLSMYYNPVIWSDAYQLSADTIVFVVVDSVNTLLFLKKSGFIAEQLYDGNSFNQVKGLQIRGNIYRKQLQTIDVIGNAECLYYILEDDSSVIGVNSSNTSEMRILFNNNEIEYIKLDIQPDGKCYPLAQLSPDDRWLKDFRWLSLYRPRSIPDLFFYPIPREKGNEQTPLSSSQGKRPPK